MSGPRDKTFNPAARHERGSVHWWGQRASALVLIPLTLWWMLSMMRLSHGDHSTALAWISQTVNATLMCALLAILFWHLGLGLRVVIEDYIHHARALRCLLLTTTILCWTLAISGITGVLILAM